MQTKIVRRQPTSDPQALGDTLDPVLRRIYGHRGVSSLRETEHAFVHLLPASGLAGMDAAVALLAEALYNDWRILIVGDFDADGATSSALSVRALQMLGAADVAYLVPNRFEYGYGLTPEIVDVAASREPQLIMTVDNGISSLHGVAAARERGIHVVITDHHLPGAALPDADAIVNPNSPGDTFPSKHLAGVGVAFYVMLALRAHLREQDWFAQRDMAEPNLAELLDLVALGTVADVVVLDHNNRILVEQGLRRIRAGRCVPGIAALLEVAGRTRARAVASDLGFAVGPRLNAAGRLEDMSIGIECLLSDDPAEARRMAGELDALNRERRNIEQGMKEQALSLMDTLQLDEDGIPYGLCLYDADWHQGVIGILAARIKERFHRPVIAFARAGEGEIKGSARSIPGLHIRDVLDAVASRNPGLISKFGGHAMAAGLSLDEARFAEFSAAFDAQVRNILGEQDLHAVIHSDGALQAAQFSLDTALLLRAAGPWGQGFPEPVFDGEFKVVQHRIVGEHHLKMSLKLPQDGRTVDAIAFFQADRVNLESAHTVQIAYKLDANEFRGQTSLQLLVEHIEIV